MLFWMFLSIVSAEVSDSACFKKIETILKKDAIKFEEFGLKFQSQISVTGMRISDDLEMSDPLVVKKINKEDLFISYIRNLKKGTQLYLIHDKDVFALGYKLIKKGRIDYIYCADYWID